MSEKEQRLAIYRASFQKLSIKQTELARLMNLGASPTRSSRSTISDKLAGAPGKAVTKAEALALQLLAVADEKLAKQGHSIHELEFDAHGLLTENSRQLLMG